MEATLAVLGLLGAVRGLRVGGGAVGISGRGSGPLGRDGCGTGAL